MIVKKNIALMEFVDPSFQTFVQIQIVNGKKKFVLISLAELKQQLENL